MKRTVISAAVLSLAVAGSGVSLAGTTDGQGAQKRGLFASDESNGACTASGNASPGSPNGFVILNAPGKPGDTSNILGEVSLKRAPGKYTVELSYNGSACAAVGAFTTNDQGNGNFHIATPGTGGSYFVVLRNVRDGAQSFATAPATVN